MRAIKTIVGFVLGASLAIAAATACARCYTPTVHYGAGVVDDKRMRAALRYHGIIFAKKMNGEWRFMRDGKKCKVFTEGFLRYYAAGLGKGGKRASL